MAPNRSVTMEVLCPGISRTGSASMCAAFGILGFAKPYHGFNITTSPTDCAVWSDLVDRKFSSRHSSFTAADFDRVLGHSAAVTDMEAACFWRELMDVYPDAKIVLVQRDVEAWYRSFNDTLLSTQFGPYGSFMAFVIQPLIGMQVSAFFRRVWQGYFGAATAAGIRKNARAVYIHHYEDIRAAAKEADRPLLDYKLGSGWGPLCAFLDNPVPDMAFPRLNDYETLQEKVKQSRKRMVGKAAWVVLWMMAKFSVPIIALAMTMHWICMR